jgi:hypothetical protein
MIGSILRPASLALALSLAIADHVRAGDFYVSPSGSPAADGSADHPWDLQTALNQTGPIKPGDTIWVRGGIYRGAFYSWLAGAPGASVTVRQYSGEQATLDGSGTGRATLSVVGPWTIYRDFEVINSDLQRFLSAGSHDRPMGINVRAPHTSFINLIVHDTGTGIGFWSEASDSVVYGCLIYNNGWDAPDRGHGHGIYAQNQTSFKYITDNIVFNQYSHGIHAYGESGQYLDNLDIEGNVVFNNGMVSAVSGAARNILVGGAQIAHNPKVINNLLYYPPGSNGQNLNLGYSPHGAGAVNAVVNGNYIGNGEVDFSSATSNLTLSGNSFPARLVGLLASLFPANTYFTSGPVGQQVFLRPNAYEPRRATIVVYNWAGLPTVDVPLQSVLPVGNSYEIRNAQDFFGSPVRTGTYAGGSVPLSTTGLSVASPLGGASQPAASPQFVVFILLPGPPGREDLTLIPGPRHAPERVLPRN